MEGSDLQPIMRESQLRHGLTWWSTHRPAKEGNPTLGDNVTIQNLPVRTDLETRALLMLGFNLKIKSLNLNA